MGEVPEGEAWAAGLWVAAGWEVVELEAVATAVAGTGVVVAEAVVGTEKVLQVVEGMAAVLVGSRPTSGHQPSRHRRLATRHLASPAVVAGLRSLAPGTDSRRSAASDRPCRTRAAPLRPSILSW